MISFGFFAYIFFSTFARNGMFSQSGSHIVLATEKDFSSNI